MITKPRMLVKTFRLREDIIKQIAERAEEEETSEATIVRQALKLYLENK